jgi:hypothetical protein
MGNGQRIKKGPGWMRTERKERGEKASVSKKAVKRQVERNKPVYDLLVRE